MQQNKHTLLRALHATIFHPEITTKKSMQEIRGKDVARMLNAGAVPYYPRQLSPLEFSLMTIKILCEVEFLNTLLLFLSSKHTYRTHTHAHNHPLPHFFSSLPLPSWISFNYYHSCYAHYIGTRIPRSEVRE